MPSTHEFFINEALKEAKLALNKGEVPIGAVIVKEGEIIGRGHNLTENSLDATMHAEVAAIKEASAREGNWRLTECDLYVTVEPCPMCMGAIRLARIKRVIYGFKESRYGFTKFAPNLSDTREFGSPPEIIGGIEGDKCHSLLQEFFKNRREELL